MEIESDSKSFWQRFDSLRGRETLKSICQKTGIKIASIKSERSTNRLPNLRDTYKLAKYLGCTIEYLLSGHSDEENYSQVEKDLIKAYREAPTYIRVCAEQALKSIIPLNNEKKSI